MQKRVVLVSAAVAMLGLAAIVLGSVASNKSKGFISFQDLDGQQHCVYPRDPALGCGVAAALLALTGVTLATVASRADRRVTGRRAIVAGKLQLAGAWVAVLVATVMFLYGAAMKRGHSRPGWHHGHHHHSRPGWRHGHYYNYGCTELKSGLFFVASVASAFATGFAIAAYVSFQRTDEPEPEPEPEPGVAMGQPQWGQPYPPPPPPVANPAPPPQYGHSG